MRIFPVLEKTQLQDFLFAALKDLKKTKIKQILKFGSVQVNGREVTWYKHPLKAGDKVEILGKERASVERSKKELGLKIIFEDNDIPVVFSGYPAMFSFAIGAECSVTLYSDGTNWHP